MTYLHRNINESMSYRDSNKQLQNYIKLISECYEKFSPHFGKETYIVLRHFNWEVECTEVKKTSKYKFGPFI